VPVIGPECVYTEAAIMRSTLLTLLVIGATLAMAETRRNLTCYDCDSKHDDACLHMELAHKTATCKAQKFCVKIHYKVAEGSSSTLLIRTRPVGRGVRWVRIRTPRPE